MPTFVVKRSEVNKILGDLIEIRSPFEYVRLKAYGLDNPNEALGLLKFLKEYCKVVEVRNSGHPLGRGTIVFSCPKIEVRVHGDWNPENNYVAIETAWL